MILVIGAGPAGLAVAYELQRRGLPYQVLERDTIGNSWTHHYDRLRLHTLKHVSGLPGLPMPASYPRFPSAEQFHAYLTTYARHFNLNITCGVDVRHADWSSGGWQLETSQGQFCGDTLVVATGIWSTPYCPSFPGSEQFGGQIIHSSVYRNPASFRGQRVLVVGVGNSGAEIAVDLREHHVQTSIAIRDGATFVPHPKSALAMRLAAWLLPRLPHLIGERALAATRRDFSAIGLPWPKGSLLDAYPVVGYALPEAVGAGIITRYGGIERFVPGGVRFADGREAPFDAVILATGYRSTVQFVAHELSLDAQGRPTVDRHWRSLSNPNLFCVGFRYPATSGWIQAIGRVAREAADTIQATKTVNVRPLRQTAD
jgi:cation diffusion facilitator CzcD-associated flavoprotein CzcO